MQDRNIIGATTSMALMPFVEFYQALTPYIILAIVLWFKKVSKSDVDIVENKEV